MALTFEARKNAYFEKLRSNKDKIVKFATINKIRDYFDICDFDLTTERELYEAEIRLNFIIDVVTKMNDTLRVVDTPIEIGKEDAQEKQKTLKVLKRMLPSKIKQLEDLGFILLDDDNPNTRGLFVVTLPIGWTLKKNNILDENGNNRGFVKDYHNTNDEIWGIINLVSKYNVHTTMLDKGQIEVYFGTDDEKMYVAGSYKTIGSRNADDKRNERNCYNAAIAYGNANYPGWQDLNAYWDDDKVINAMK